MVWRSINNKPQHMGLYVVAHFKGDNLIEFSTDYCVLTPGYLQPNAEYGPGISKITHWMPYSDYRTLLSNVPRDV